MDWLTPAVAAEDGLGHVEVDIVEEGRDKQVVHVERRGGGRSATNSVRPILVRVKVLECALRGRDSRNSEPLSGAPLDAKAFPL